MHVVKAENEAREASKGTKISSTQAFIYQSQFQKHYKSSASTLVANEFKLQCAYCKGAHYSAS